MASGEEVQRALHAFVAKWEGYSGSEKAWAQTFLNGLFACYGSDCRDVGAEFEFYIPQTGGFMDLHWPEVCVIEMKAPTVKVETAQPQVEAYWRASSKPELGQAAARWIVICNFHEFEIWEPGRFPTQPVASFSLTELPERYDALNFLAGPNLEPSFVEHNKELTKDAAAKVAEVFHSLKDRRAAPGSTIQSFILQSVWCMFAEDLRMLADYPFDKTLRSVRNQPDDSAAKLGHLFQVLNQKTNHNRKGVLAGTRYVNGELFARPAAVDLTTPEIDLLIEAGKSDWTKVDPTIFGSLLEGVLGRDKRWELGAHYTHEIDIMKIVGPTIVRPWRERIEATTSPQEARDLLDELCRFRVLDPACGCGNFLYVAYRELRRLEHELKARIRRLAADKGLPEPPGPWPFYPLVNLQGIDIERTAVMISRVTLWMGHRQMIEVYGEAEDPLPLQSLDGIRQGDALRVEWPETDCIVGNPPFLGAKFIRPQLGDSFADGLIKQFGVGVKDLCVYWFRRAHDHLMPGQRAGLVGTNSVSQTGGRAASLAYIESEGGIITDAVSSQKWPGDAKVHVSLVNWVKQPPTPPTAWTLDGVEVTGISSQLRPEDPGHEPQRLAANTGRCFAGVVPQAKGFIISSGEAAKLLASEDADYTAVVRCFLTGDDLTTQPDQSPTRWIVDFGSMGLEDASRYPAAIKIARERVKPEREASENRAVERRWWLFGRRVEGMRVATAPLERYIAAGSTGKRLTMAWQRSTTLANNAVCVFAFEDDYSMGVLLSRGHGAWAWARSSTLKGDLRYTSAAVFMTFPWPDPVTDEQRERVAEASRRLLARRTEICTSENIGLTKLYNAVDDGAWADLKALHRTLDEAVAACYGWPVSIAQDDRELVRRLGELNQEIAEGSRPYEPFGYLDR